MSSQRLLAQAADASWLSTADLYDLATVWRTARSVHNELAAAPGAADAVELRLRREYPEMMASYDDALQQGARPEAAIQTAARLLPDTLRRIGDGALTSSVRGGPSVSTASTYPSRRSCSLAVASATRTRTCCGKPSTITGRSPRSTTCAALPEATRWRWWSGPDPTKPATP